MEPSRKTETELRCCLLQFTPRGWGHWISSLSPKALVMVIEQEDGSLQFLIERDFEQRLKVDDIAFLLDVVRDFPTRSKTAPRALFEELCALNAGPLVTRKAFFAPPDDPSFVEVRSKFLRISWE